MTLKTPKAIGNEFEMILRRRCLMTGVAITRIHDGCSTTGNNFIMRRQQICDFIVSWSGMSGLLDAKSCGDLRFNFSAITKHQVDEMLQHERAGIKAGYIILFRKIQKVIFFPASTLAGMQSRTSLGVDGGLLLGSTIDFDVRKIFGVTCVKKAAVG